MNITGVAFGPNSVRPNGFIDSRLTNVVPTVLYNYSGYVTVIIYDENANYLHALIVNTNLDVNDSLVGNVIASYEPMQPPNNEVHTYTVYLLAQDTEFDTDTILDMVGIYEDFRKPFNIDGFIEEYGLELYDTFSYRSGISKI